MRAGIVACILICFAFSGAGQSLYQSPLQIEAIAPVIEQTGKLLPDSLYISSSIYVRQYTGMFSDVRQNKYSLHGNRGKSQYGISIHSDREGEYIATNRFYANYTVSILLNKSTVLFAGASAGLVNIAIGDNTSNSQGSDMVPDAKLGLGIRRKHEIIQLSASQLLQSELAPLEYTHTLSRYFQLYVAKHITFDDQLNVRLYILASAYTDRKNHVSAGIATRWNRYAEIGFGISETTGAIGFLDVVIFDKQYKISAVVLYEMQNALSGHGDKVSTFQVGMNLKNKRK